MADIKLKGSNFFATFKTEKELKDYIEGHSVAEERRLLWLGVMFGSILMLNKLMKHLT